MTGLANSGRLGVILKLVGLGRKSPLGGHGWVSSPKRREAAIFGHSPYRRQWLLNAESGHPKND